jgi:hypothetical protein
MTSSVDVIFDRLTVGSRFPEEKIRNQAHGLAL